MFRNASIYNDFKHPLCHKYFFYKSEPFTHSVDRRGQQRYSGSIICTTWVINDGYFGLVWVNNVYYFMGYWGHETLKVKAWEFFALRKDGSALFCRHLNTHSYYSSGRLV